MEDANKTAQLEAKIAQLESEIKQHKPAFEGLPRFSLALQALNERYRADVERLNSCLVSLWNKLQEAKHGYDTLKKVIEELVSGQRGVPSME